MGFGIPDRVGMHDWFWRATIERWRQEGLPEKANLADRYGFDIAQIAYETGYLSEAAFSRAFKRELGRSPAAFRRPSGEE